MTQNALLLIRQVTENVDPEQAGIEVSGVSRDPDDDNILAAALASGADFIVTGDLDLLHLKSYHKIKILTPREFLTKLES